MGYYSNAGQNLANVEQIGVAKVAGAVLGIAHLKGNKSNTSNVQLSKEVGALGEEEINIAKGTQQLEEQKKNLASENEKISKTEQQLASQQERYQQLRKETGLNNPAFEEEWAAAKTSSDKAREMYNRSMDEMKKKADLLDIQKRNFETRKQLIMSALERSGK